MTEAQSSSPDWDPHELIEQAAALAVHLQRSGLRWLPKPDSAAVEKLAKNFRPLDQVQTDSNHVEHDSNRAESLGIDRGSVTSRPSQRHETSTGLASANLTSPPRKSPATADTKTSTPSSPPTVSGSANSRRRLDSVDAVAIHGEHYPGESLPTETRSTQLQAMQTEVAECSRCEILSNCRTKTVFGEGNPQPRMVFFGEGPGADEDRSGRPFVGQAGKLLTRMIEACQLKREETYILNTVKCRPPANRNPEAEELANCRDYYERQLNVLRPEYIICLGAVSAQELLKTKLSVGRLRGQFHSYYASKVLVTFHPAYLLRNPSAKKAAWQDLQFMMRDAGILK